MRILLAKRKVAAKIPQKLTELQTLLAKINEIRKVLNSVVLERQEETDGILLSVLSGANALFLGEPGTAKTFHLQLASKLLGLSNFDILLSETVKPDQIFGPTDIPALAEGKQQTKYIGYAPDCEILFFDEIFKANATVLNPLLWLINEHLFRDGDNGIVKCKVMASFAASNELPTDPLLAALYDRFLLRFNVTYLKSDDNIRKMINSSLSIPEEFGPILTKVEVDRLRELTKTVVLPDEMRDKAMVIRRQVEYTMGFKISDRRFVKSIRVIQASAVLNGRLEVERQDLEVLVNILWNEPDQLSKIQSIVYSSTSGDVVEISTYLEQAQAIASGLKTGAGLRENLNELKKLYQLTKRSKSRYALKAASEIKAIGQLVLRLIKERKTFTCVPIKSGETVILKLSPVTASVWSTAELRSLGFKHKRKGSYWYYVGRTITLRNALLKRNSSLVLTESTVVMK